MTTALEGVRGQLHALAALYPRKEPVPIVQGARWAAGPVWTGAENLAPPGFDPRTYIHKKFHFHKPLEHTGIRYKASHDSEYDGKQSIVTQ